MYIFTHQEEVPRRFSHKSIEQMDKNVYASVGVRNPLFEKLLDSKLADLSTQLLPLKFTVSGSENKEKAHLTVTSLQKGGFATFWVDLRQFWATQDAYFQSCREAALVRGLRITRVFIVPKLLLSKIVEEAPEGPERSGSLRPKLSLLEHVAEDSAANIIVRIALSEELESEWRQDFGLWDEVVLCHVTPVSHGSAEVRATYSVDPDDLARSRTWREKINLQSREPSAMFRDSLPIALSKTGSVLTLEDAVELAESAPFMLKDAEHCSGKLLSGPSPCGWYHGPWQFLRSLDMVSTPDWHSAFYRKHLSEAIARLPKARVLVSGLADYAMLEHVCAASSQAQATPGITVLDACRTPLRACLRYAKRHNVKIRTVEEDILAVGTAHGQQQSFGLITSDAFLTRFAHSIASDLLRAWHSLLLPGGRVVTTIRVGQANPTETHYLETFADRALMRAVDRPYLSTTVLGGKAIRSMALDYARRIRSYPYTPDEVTQLVTQAGFKVLYREQAPTSGELIPSDYLRVVLERI